MPFIIPEKLNKIGVGDRFSKWKNLESDAGSFFLLQKRKFTFRNERVPTYRIITQFYPYYEVANADDFDDIKNTSWKYVTTRLSDVPVHLPTKVRHMWFISHFTQKALETGNLENIEKAQEKGPDTDEEPLEGYDYGAGSDKETYDDDNGSPTFMPNTPPLEFESEGRSSRGELTSQLRRRGHNHHNSSSTRTRRERDLLNWKLDNWKLDELAHKVAHVESEEANTPQRLRLKPVQRPTETPHGTPRKPKEHKDKLLVFGGPSWCMASTLVVWLSCIIVRDAQLPVFASILLVVHLCMVWLSFYSPYCLGFSLTKRASSVTSVTLTKRASSVVATANPTVNATKPVVRRRRGSEESNDEKESLVMGPAFGSVPSTEGVDSTEGVNNVPRDSKTKVTPDRTLANKLRMNGIGRDTFDSNSWCDSTGTHFLVRNYRGWSKEKVPSLESMYECVGLDIFKAPTCKIDHIMQSIDTSSFLANEKERFIGPVPKLFVCNFQVPESIPNMGLFSSKPPGEPGFSVVFYFKMKETTDEQLRSDSPLPAFALLKRWFQQMEDGNPEHLKRLKCIPRVWNPDDLNISGVLKNVIHQWNCKPFMTGPTCNTFHRGDDYVEMDCNAHAFKFFARRMIPSFLDIFPQLVGALGMVIQAEDQEEQPEQILGACCWSRVEPCSGSSILASS